MNIEFHIYGTAWNVSPLSFAVERGEELERKGVPVVVEVDGRSMTVPQLRELMETECSHKWRFVQSASGNESWTECAVCGVEKGGGGECHERAQANAVLHARSGGRRQVQLEREGRGNTMNPINHELRV